MEEGNAHDIQSKRLPAPPGHLGFFRKPAHALAACRPNSFLLNRVLYDRTDVEDAGCSNILSAS